MHISDSERVYYFVFLLILYLGTPRIFIIIGEKPSAMEVSTLLFVYTWKSGKFQHLDAVIKS